MSWPVRVAILIGIVIVIIGFFAFILGNGKDSHGGVDHRLRWQSAEQCRDCHQQLWQEWMGSHHQIAYQNPEVQLLSDNFRNKECQACHLPRPISVTGYGRRTLPRLTHPQQGVSCLSCHLGKNGEILARHGRKDVGCQPVQSDALISVELCASCHNQHGTTDQWRASAFAAVGTDCSDCHMPNSPDRSNAGAGPGRDHRFLGAHDVSMLRQACRFEAGIKDGELHITLTNTGAGHNFPTEERHRAVDIVYCFLSTGEEPKDWIRGYRFRQPYRDESGKDTQLPSGDEKVLRIAIPADASRAVVRLWYRLTPYVGDDDPRSMLLAEEEVSVR